MRGYEKMNIQNNNGQRILNLKVCVAYVWIVTKIIIQIYSERRREQKRYSKNKSRKPKIR